MISGAHVVLFSSEPDVARELLRDVFELPAIDAGDGWLIFALPAAEVAVHPGEGGTRHELYLMCEDIEVTVAELEERGVELVRPIADQGWGRVAAIAVPGGGELSIYEPRHPLPPRARE